jgi:hypothetical protein
VLDRVSGAQGRDPGQGSWTSSLAVGDRDIGAQVADLIGVVSFAAIQGYKKRRFAACESPCSMAERIRGVSRIE